MKLFCLLWIPLFYLFWSSLVPERTAGTGGILALILGSIVSLTGFFLGSFAAPGDFGLSRWKSGFIDIVSVPVLLPLAVFVVLLPFKVSNNFGNFALLWLIPDIGIQMVNWSTQNNPLLLILVPLLRTALAIGISAGISLIMTKKLLFIIPAVLGILVLPLTGAASYWAFFGHKSSWGYIFFAVTAFPAAASIIVLIFRKAGDISIER